MQKPEPSSIPASPGAYLYRDAQGRVIYVGKARVLRRRVLSYFRREGLSPKTRAMIGRARSVEFITTTTEKEALLLESSLIKKHRPHYNVALRDDKQYFLFRMDLKAAFPRLEIVRRPRRDGARYFGPFTSAIAARDTWKLLHRTFSLRRCSDRAMKNRVRPCLYHHMGQCPAPCMGLVESGRYHETVRQVCALLDGDAQGLLATLKAEMEAASETLEFERAAVLRDRIRAVERTVERQAVVMPGKADTDAVGLFEGGHGLALGIVRVRGGAVNDGSAFWWPGLTWDDASEAVLAFLEQYYAELPPPARILLPWAVPASTETPKEEGRAHRPVPQAGGDGAGRGEDADGDDGNFWAVLRETLSERRAGPVHLVGPQNDADGRLLDLARSNAREEARRRENHDVGSILDRIARALHLDGPPLRIECVDVSHTGGRQTRVGMVVYENGLPAR
ncbi:MAG: excinuclease ABC subunit UvrC, partial [Desulfovibrio sp.]|nr:excinuclease ABC subunit UvrC [Desulfovibrio sp.]